MFVIKLWEDVSACSKMDLATAAEEMISLLPESHVHYFLSFLFLCTTFFLREQTMNKLCEQNELWQTNRFETYYSWRTQIELTW